MISTANSLRFGLALLLLFAMSVPAYAWPNPVEQTELKLRTRIRSGFDKVPLGDVLQSLSNKADVKIHCHFQSLHAERVTPSVPVSLALATPISLRSILILILEPLSLTYVVRRDGTIEVISLAELPKLEADLPVVERVYDMSPLLSGRRGDIARASLSAQGTETKLTSFVLVDLITETVAPQSWKLKGRSLVVSENDSQVIVVSQTIEGHREIDDLLHQLRRLSELRILTTVDDQVLELENVEAFARDQKLAMPLVKLDAAQAEAFSHLKSAKRVRRNYFNFNGETFTTTPRLDLHAVVGWDRTFVRLARSLTDEVDTKQVDELLSGEMLLLDMTDDETAKKGQRRYVTIRPKIMAATESDNVSYDPVPPRERETWGLRIEE